MWPDVDVFLTFLGGLAACLVGAKRSRRPPPTGGRGDLGPGEWGGAPGWGRTDGRSLGQKMLLPNRYHNSSLSESDRLGLLVTVAQEYFPTLPTKKHKHFALKFKGVCGNEKARHVSTTLCHVFFSWYAAFEIIG